MKTNNLSSRHHAFRFVTTLFPALLFSLTSPTSSNFYAKEAYRGIPVVSQLSHTSGKLGNYVALVIGINDYEDDRIPDLKTAVADAESVVKLLKKRYGFQSIELLKNRNATGRAIDRAFREKIRNLGPNDSLLIYYAGHGEEDRLVGDGWWVPADAVAGDTTTYFENTTVQKYLRAMNARHVLLVSDSCYSGLLFGESRALPPVINDRFYLDLYNEKSRWGMTSGNKTPVADRGFGGHSVFAYQFLKKLEKNRKAYMTPREIYADIGPIVRNNSEQMPICRPIRMAGDQGGEFVFILAASSGATVDKPSERATQTTLSVESNVSNARVFVDGREVGQTPMRDILIQPGDHDVRVEMGGYEPYRQRIRIEKGRSFSLQVLLSEAVSAKGRLYVETNPSDARVRILNIGPRFYQGMELEPGRYHVEVSAIGYDQERLWVGLTEGEDKSITIRLQPLETVPSEGRFTNRLGMQFVYIPPGSFMMGSPPGEKGRDSDERQHNVTLTQGFYMQTTEVTQGQWKAVMGNNPSRFKGNGDNCPVEQVSWNDVQEFIRKLNRTEGTDKYRLPTETQWEYACRADTETAFSNGGLTEIGCGIDPNLDQVGWYCGNSGKKTHTVASKRPNAWGLYDMHGNVFEWCQDWYGEYPSGHVKDPTGPSSGSDRVARGGGWSNNAGGCRSANRGRGNPGYWGGNLGFRLARSE